MDLPTLLERCRQGDDLAWEALVRRFQGRVYGIALFYLRNAEDARDLAQEIFIRIYRRLDTCTNDETFVPWMVRLARNAAIDRLRRVKARPITAAVPVDAMVDLVADGPDPEERWRRNRRSSLVRRAMARLSEISREIILLKEIQGLSLEAISSTLEIPVGTVKSRSNRARLELASAVIALSKESVIDGSDSFISGRERS
jgi:RNA polymerase sigma-70 factor, ECF subfamily